ncbi:hypothetical protein [Streptomyces lateritius]|uniref:hypothetical protein n=1 Tax=Streptomyces lateritius TaxID=67313 RepID=UPI00167477B7|nr:hypothetical protein [Streptomyces lateritius]
MNYYWPGNPNGRGGEIDWWQSTMLLRMYNGDQVSGMVAVLPETFTALPSTLPRKEHRRGRAGGDTARMRLLETPDLTPRGQAAGQLASDLARRIPAE